MANIWRRNTAKRLNSSLFIKKTNSDVSQLIADDFFDESAVNAITGTVAVTLNNATSTATGAETFTGTSAQTNVNMTSSASAFETFIGSSSQNASDFVSDAAAIEEFSGYSSIVLVDGFSSASAVQSFIGTSEQSFNNITSVASGTIETSSGVFNICITNGERFYIKNKTVISLNRDKEDTYIETSNLFIFDNRVYIKTAMGLISA